MSKNSSISNNSVKHKHTVGKTFPLQAIQFTQTIQFSISMLLVLFNPQIGPSGPGSNGNEGVLRIPQSSSTAGTSPSDCLVSYPGHSLGGGSYPSAEVQSVYSTAPADWAIHRVKCHTVLFQKIQLSISTQFRRQKQFYFE